MLYSDITKQIIRKKTIGLGLMAVIIIKKMPQ
jgi:hypothetical protein